MVFPLGSLQETTCLESHCGHLADLISIMKRAYYKWDCAVLCGSAGSKPCPIFWSEIQGSIVLDKACEKDISVRMDPQPSTSTGKGEKEKVCQAPPKGGKCAILYYNVGGNLSMIKLFVQNGNYMITELIFHLDPDILDPSGPPCPETDGWILAKIADEYICVRALSGDPGQPVGTYQELKDNPITVN